MFKKIKRYTSKCLSIVLSVTTLLITGMPNTMANKNTKTVQKTDSTASSFKKILKKHPILCTGAAIFGTALICKIISVAKSEWDLIQKASKLVSKIDNLSPKEIDEAILKELDTYTGRAPDVFVYDQSLLQMDHRLLLRTLIQLNYLFEKYDKFTIDLINYKRHNSPNKQFNLRCRAPSDKENFLAETHINMGITFNSENYEDYKYLLYVTLHSMHNKFNSQCDETMLVEHAVSHEFGHLISFLFLFRINNSYQYIQSPDRILNELAKLIFGSYEKCFISEYGKKNGSEFIAEVFANLECNKPENVDPLGRDLENFLINRAKYLSPEKANLRNIS